MATISIGSPHMKTDDAPSLFLTLEAIAVGELVYLDANSKAGIADNTDAGKDEVEGVALTAADLGKYVTVAVTGTIEITNTIIIGEVYILSDNGDVQLATDLASTEYLSVVGTADSTSSIVLNIDNTGSQKA